MTLCSGRSLHHGWFEENNEHRFLVALRGDRAAAVRCRVADRGGDPAGYSAWQTQGSYLALSNQGWEQIANFLVSGSLCIAFAVGLRRIWPTGRASVWGPLLIGLFVTDPGGGYPPGAPRRLLRAALALRRRAAKSSLGDLLLVDWSIHSCDIYNQHHNSADR